MLWRMRDEARAEIVARLCGVIVGEEKRDRGLLRPLARDLQVTVGCACAGNPDDCELVVGFVQNSLWTLTRSLLPSMALWLEHPVGHVSDEKQSMGRDLMVSAVLRG